MKWIKASERLPENTHNYFVRATKKYQGYNHNDTAFFRKDDKSWEFKGCNNCYVLEWLDESEEQNNDAIEKAIKFCDEKYNSVSDKEYGEFYLRCAYNEIKEYLQSLAESQPKKEEVKS